MKAAVSSDNKQILVVEDSPTQAEELKYLLEVRGYKVFLAGNGKDALDVLARITPLLVISDIVMPEMNGYELCRRMKQDKGLRGIPVILLTALSDPRDVIKGLECGADNFLVKPYDENYLLSRMDYIIANRELRAHAKIDMGIEVIFSGQRYFISSERRQILDLLLSTYEAATHKNHALLERRRSYGP